MDFKDLLSRIDGIVSEDKAGSMKSAERHATGPKFTGKWKGTDDAGQAKTKYVGGESQVSILKDFEQQLKENPRTAIKRDLMREYREYVTEYGGTGGYGAASQAPQGTDANAKDPAAIQQKINQQQIQKSTNLLKPTLNAQGAEQQLNPAKFTGVMDKLDAASNTHLSNQEQNQLSPLAVSASKLLKNPSTANQFKQLVTKADQLDKQQQEKLAKQQQPVGTNTPADQQQTPGQPPKPGQTPQAGQPPSAGQPQ